MRVEYFYSCMFLPWKFIANSWELCALLCAYVFLGKYSYKILFKSLPHCTQWLQIGERVKEQQLLGKCRCQEATSQPPFRPIAAICCVQNKQSWLHFPSGECLFYFFAFNFRGGKLVDLGNKALQEKFASINLLLTLPLQKQNGSICMASSREEEKGEARDRGSLDP